MSSPRFRIFWPSIFCRAFAAVAILMEVSLYFKLRPWLQHRGGGFRVAAMIYKSPKPLGRAFLWAALITLGVQLYVRLVMRPLLARWYSPRPSPLGGADRLAFCLASGETILHECPARLIVGRRGEPGTLIRTDRATWFAPHSWDVPSRSILDTELATIATRPARPWTGTLLLGVPDRLILTSTSGTTMHLLTADPAVPRQWLASAVV